MQFAVAFQLAGLSKTGEPMIIALFDTKSSAMIFVHAQGVLHNINFIIVDLSTGEEIVFRWDDGKWVQKA
jgi:hypothetical protein